MPQLNVNNIPMPMPFPYEREARPVSPVSQMLREDSFRPMTIEEYRASILAAEEEYRLTGISYTQEEMERWLDSRRESLSLEKID
jgi:hypothetical protein